MSTIRTAEAMAILIIQEIQQDMEKGDVPSTVKSFAELHDYVDANEYLINAVDYTAETFDPADAEKAERDNKAMDLVNVWLAARR